MGGFGAPAYLSVQGHRYCLGKQTTAGGSTSLCRLKNKPIFCTSEAWEQLKTAFKGEECPRQLRESTGGTKFKSDDEMCFIFHAKTDYSFNFRDPRRIEADEQPPHVYSSQYQDSSEYGLSIPTNDFSESIQAW